MSKRSSHVQQGLGFLVGCSLLGAFLYVVSNDTSGASERASQGAQVEAAANQAADKLDAEADAIGGTVSSTKAPAAISRPNDDNLSEGEGVDHYEKSVFGDGSKGTLACAFDGSIQFIVDWKTNDQDGVVTVNGNRTKGTVIGDWEPASNKTRYDIEIGGAKDPGAYHVEIADDGTLTGEGGKTGSCRIAN